MEQNMQQPQNQNQNAQNTTNNAPKPQQPQQPKPVNGAPKQSKRNLIVSGIVILVVLGLLILIPRIKTSAPATDTKADAETEEVDASGATPSDDKDTPLSRGAALVAYQGKMITVSGDCEVSPETQTQKAGTTILINNDTTTAHTITVGPKSYRVSGLHYTLSWLNLQPGTLAITCDGETSKATIVVE